MTGLKNPIMDPPKRLANLTCEPWKSSLENFWPLRHTLVTSFSGFCLIRFLDFKSLENVFVFSDLCSTASVTLKDLDIVLLLSSAQSFSFDLLA